MSDCIVSGDLSQLPAGTLHWDSNITWDGKWERLYRLPLGVWLLHWRWEGNWPDHTPEEARPLTDGEAQSWLLLHAPAALADPRIATPSAPTSAHGLCPCDGLIAENLARLADAVAGDPSDLVGTDHVAKRLGCTPTWVAEMLRDGQVPKECVVPGTGHGKPWKFYRGKVDQWINSGRR